MGRVVADQLQRLGRRPRDDRDGGVAGDRQVQILHLAVDLGGQRMLGQAGTDRACDFAAGDALGGVAQAAVGQGDIDSRLAGLSMVARRRVVDHPREVKPAATPR